MFELRDYQKKAVGACIDHIESKSKAKSVVVAPTGAGKSLIIASVAKRLKNPVLVIQPSKELLEQNYSKFVSFGGEASIYSASLKSKEIGHCTFATPQSIVKELEILKQNKVKTVLIDEAHYNCKTGSIIDRIVKGLKAENVIGFTASPVILTSGMFGAYLAMLNRSKHSIFSDIIHCTQIKELVDKNFWSPIDYKIYKQDTSALRYNSNQSDFTDKSLIEYYKGNNLKEQILNKVEEIQETARAILVFVPSIAEAVELSNLIPNSAAVHSNMKPKERNFVVNAFKDGKIKVVINVNILGIGFDFPELDNIIEARPTGSLAIFYQHIGRGVRIHPSKKKLNVFDYSGNTEKFGKIEDITFEEVEGFGWGMFSNNKLISGIAIAASKPDKESLIVKQLPASDVAFHFGKYNGMKVSDVIIKDSNYISWMLNNKDFSWSGDKNTLLKKAIDELVVKSSIKFKKVL